MRPLGIGGDLSHDLHGVGLYSRTVAVDHRKQAFRERSWPGEGPVIDDNKSTVPSPPLARKGRRQR